VLLERTKRVVGKAARSPLVLSGLREVHPALHEQVERRQRALNGSK